MSDVALAPRSLILVLVAFHPSQQEVNCLKLCLKSLPKNIGYAVVVNDYRAGEPVDELESKADYWLAN